MSQDPRLTLDEANRIVTGALEKAGTLGLKPLTVVVLDAGSHAIALQRQDNSSTMRPQIATAKASSALGLGIPSRKIAEMAAERPSFVAALGAIAPDGVVPSPGGVLISRDGKVAIGAVGITGDTGDNDEACALAGLAAAGLQSLG